eukprot:CAMPEP_0196580486 /NCGR_PEP_ID=MMETSP1081-20130531/28758_1 /TAXON_ID=36882 /ORGANISM="Pyramimonas amylifera, Strain CCMP720" /LENGTH=142 /DNA_ID=CAMNT_0041900359 /DNA_START=335 /DNA_END=763 /DNA_ORIENTATION=-
MTEMVQEKLDSLQQELFDSGVLDDQFSQLQMLEDESNPDFVAEMVQLYFEDTSSKLEKLAGLVSSPTNLAELDSTFHQLKGSSTSIGALAMANACANCREECQQQNPVSIQTAFNQINIKFKELKEKLGELMQLQDQIRASS